MSGHSKWASIKHKKAVVDAKKGKEFTRVANMITIAAKQGGADPKMNFALRLAIDKAKASNMPSANIERSIKRGTGELGGVAPEELIYEGYAPGGVAILIEAMTDNRNRTASEIRSTFSKYGGSMADAGSVSYLFEQKGELILLNKSQKFSKEEIENFILDSVAEDFEDDNGIITIYTKSTNLQKVKEDLETKGAVIDSAALIYKPKNEIKINEESMAVRILKLIDFIEESEDITNVYANFDISDEILSKLS
jgi:YebC/PmpR family DNA-binding regulatory protein